jgi:hypothetical protein
VRRSQKFALSLACGFAMLLAIGACRSPTQMTLDVTYGGQCADLKAVAFIVGTDPAASESRIATHELTTTTTQCEPSNGTSHVGTLVVTPNDDSGRASVIVLTGVTKTTDKCTADDGYFGCIIARRIFSFVDHTSLAMEIPLDLDCVNVPCNAVSTCNKGACIDAHQDCESSGCHPAGQLDDGGVPSVDAPSSSDAYVQQDGPVQPPSDGAVDAPVDAPDDTTTGIDAASCVGCALPLSCTVPNGTTKSCALGNYCCYATTLMFNLADAATLDASTSSSGYDCRVPGACNPQNGNGNVQCLSAANCQAGYVCCAYAQFGTFCNQGQCPGSADAMMTERVCIADCECGGRTCSGMRAVGDSPAQTYKVCQ